MSWKDDKNKQKEIAKLIMGIINNIDGLPEELKYTEDEINACIDDPKREEIRKGHAHNEEVINSLKKIVTDFEKENNINPDKSNLFARGLSLLLKEEKTEEDKKFNKGLLTEIYNQPDPKATLEHIILVKVLNTDPTEFFKDKNSIEDNLEYETEHLQDERMFFAIGSILDKAEYIDKDLGSQIKNNLKILETLGGYNKTCLDIYTSDFMYFLPDKFLKPLDKDIAEKIASAVQNEFIKNKEKYVSLLGQSDFGNFITGTGKIIQHSLNSLDKYFLIDEITNDNIDKNILLKGKYKLNGKDVRFSDLLPSTNDGNCPDGIEFVKNDNDLMDRFEGLILDVKVFKDKDYILNEEILKSENEKLEIKTNEYINLRLRSSVDAKSTYEDTLKILQNNVSPAEYCLKIRKTHSVFSKDSEEFKDLEKALNDYTDNFYATFGSEQKLPKGFKCNLVGYPSAEKAYSKLGILQERLVDYIDKKEAELAKGIKDNKRSHERLDLAKEMFEKFAGGRSLENFVTVRREEAKKKEALAAVDNKLRQKIEVKSDVGKKLDSQFKKQENKVTEKKKEAPAPEKAKTKSKSAKK